MNRTFKALLGLLVAAAAFACSGNGTVQSPVVSIKTTLGDIKVRLYPETPVHMNNFLTLVNTGTYEGVPFHRVIEGFMIQGGDTDKKEPAPAVKNDTLSEYTLPAELNPALFHRKGALAAARMGNDVNPWMRSSGTQFYIVQGKVLNDSELTNAEERINNNIRQALLYRTIREIRDSLSSAGASINDAEVQELAFLRQYEILEKRGEYRIPEEQRAVYRSIGGTPRLDGTYTVFGEVIEGLDIVDRIAAVETDSADRPVSDIRIIKMKVEKK